MLSPPTPQIGAWCAPRRCIRICGSFGLSLWVRRGLSNERKGVAVLVSVIASHYDTIVPYQTEHEAFTKHVVRRFTDAYCVGVIFMVGPLSKPIAIFGRRGCQKFLSRHLEHSDLWLNPKPYW